MNDIKIDINVASVPDRDDVVAEIWVNGAMFAELRVEHNEIFTEIYPRSSKEPWVLPSGLLLKTLSEAQSRLSGRD